jgi:hypothetical protein
LRAKESLDNERRTDFDLYVPNHFYAAYIFDQAGTHKEDIRFLIEGDQRLDYAVGTGGCLKQWTSRAALTDSLFAFIIRPMMKMRAWFCTIFSMRKKYIMKYETQRRLMNMFSWEGIFRKRGFDSFCHFV